MTRRESFCSVLLAAFSVLVVSCTSLRIDDLLANGEISVKTDSSETAEIYELSVVQDGIHTEISGFIKYKEGKTFKEIPGHIDIEIFAPSGTTLLRASLPYRQTHPGSTAYGKFGIIVVLIIPPDSMLRVSHHPLPIDVDTSPRS